ncbi:hypothetical protein HHI36_000071 [Cryptolaemus montrouzieri]|uniref:AAA+ ATPase domain-containing protein n=1 Tax=Cryptolaemus montrouzieri TaxID=559131 RepID=A0ABD2P3Z9_9CUCU
MDDYIIPEDLSMPLDYHQIISACIMAFQSYDSLLTEFSNPEEHMDYLNILQKIGECSRAIQYILARENGSFTFQITLYRLQNQLVEFYSNILLRKNLFDSKKVSQSSVLNVNTNQTSKKVDLNLAVKNTIEKPKINGFNDIAGLWEAKIMLKTSIILPKKQPQLFEKRKLSNTLLLYGPPGTGKTLLAHAVAAEMEAVFHTISASDILSPLVGESEKLMKSLFQYVKTSDKYSIIFIDEIDGFCRKRSASEQEYSRRLKTEIMCQMSNVEACQNVFIIAATNCPWDLDSAILRRFQKNIYVSLPEKLERLDLLKFHTRDTPLEMLENSGWDELVNITEGFSNSDLTTMVRNAMDIPVMELHVTKLWKKSIDDFYEPISFEDDFSKAFFKDLGELPPNSVRARPFKLEDLITEAKKYKCTVSEEDMRKYELFNKK